MELKHGVAREDLKAGTVILPHSIADPIERPDLVGPVLVRDVKHGGAIISKDLSANDNLLCAFADIAKLDQLVALDQQTFAELGQRYADEPWIAANFAHPLPDKPGLSYVMLAADGRLLGFWIASQRNSGQAHTHRVAVVTGCRNGVVSRQLFAAHWKAVVERPGIKSLTLEVGSGNKRAQAFYRTLGYIQANAMDTCSYLERHQRLEVVRGLEIVSPSGYLSRLMTRMMETNR
ncbi:MAG TPA: GNAT family N-acetyltransferase [Anaerolineae bacterium]|jgi:ribosomal protein S18 acetylase RimI-like enzyme|nr:GNAT family N-acetyltransferase [Anaerolineae bacterium]